MMEYRQLGRTNIKVSVYCLGTMTWGQQNTAEEAFAQMDAALGQGVNFWDTAEMYSVPPRQETYGRTEEIIGQWFAKTRKRQDVVLATKIVGPGVGYIRGGAGLSGSAITAALEASLKRLQTDYVDLYQLHWPHRYNPHFGKHWHVGTNPADREAELARLHEVLEALGQQVKAGKIRAIGVSNDTAWGVNQMLRMAEQAGLPRLASIQNEYSLLDRIFERELAETALYEQVGLLAWSPLATGILSGKYLAGARPAGSRATLAGASTFRLTANVESATQKYLALAKTHGLDPCQMAIAFCVQQRFMTSVIAGATSMAQLKNNIAGAHLKLSTEVLAGIDSIYRQNPMPF